MSSGHQAFAKLWGFKAMEDKCDLIGSNNFEARAFRLSGRDERREMPLGDAEVSSFRMFTMNIRDKDVLEIFAKKCCGVVAPISTSIHPSGGNALHSPKLSFQH